jgi:hypothetical protein
MGDSVVSKKASAKAKAKSAAKKKKRSDVGPAEAPEEIFRSKLWLDDLTTAIETALAGADCNDKDNSKTKALLFSLGLEFAWKGSVTFQNVKYDDWSALRKTFRNFAFKSKTDAGADDEGKHAQVGTCQSSLLPRAFPMSAAMFCGGNDASFAGRCIEAFT